MRKGEPLIRIEQETEERLSSEIFQKCIPGTFEVAALWKEYINALKELGPNPPDDLVAELDRHFREKVEVIRQRYSSSPSPAPNRFPTDVIFSARASEHEKALKEFLHWERYKSPWKKDIEKREARDGEAARRTIRTDLDYEGLRCDHKRPKPPKWRSEHSSMFDVLWGFGVETLTPETLAYFFDCFCPCGAAHEPENLRKQRDRYSKALSLATK